MNRGRFVQWAVAINVLVACGGTLAFAQDGDPLPEIPGAGDQEATILTYTGDTTARYGEPALLEGTLTAGFPPSPLPGKSLRLSVGPDSCTTGHTDAAGKASCEVTVTSAPGFDVAVARFDGDDDHLPSAGIAPVAIEKGTTALEYTGPTRFSKGRNASVSGRLSDGSGGGIAGRAVSFTIGTQSCEATTDADGTAACGIPALTGGATVESAFAGDSLYEAAGDSDAVVLSGPTVTSYTGDTSAAYDTRATLSGTLTSEGSPVAAKTLSFGLGSVSCHATTDASGAASCTVTVTDRPGSYEARVAFGGDDEFDASSASSPFTIEKLGTATTYTGGSFFAAGRPATLSATLREAGGDPVVGRDLALSLGSQQCTGTTGVSGSASCVIANVSQPTGPVAVEAAFAGDDYYTASGEQTSATLFAFSVDGGAFAVGDRSATGDVVFWGGEWYKRNSLSGGEAPSTFKGFTYGPPACGRTWTTDTGGSAPPPATVPDYIAVVVTGKTSKSGSLVRGDTRRVVIVKTHPGYGPDPRQTGTGTVVGTYC